MLLNKIIKFTCLSLSLLPLISLTSCNKEQINRKDLFFTELYCGEYIDDCVLELTINNKDLKHLNGIKVNFYGSHDLTYTYTFDDTLLKSNIVLFVNKDSNYIDDINTIIKLDSNYICGRYYVEVTSNKGTVYDSLGIKDFNLDYVKNQSLVRLNEYYEGREIFNELDFIKVRSNVTSYLGNNKSPLTIEEIKKGPKLDKQYLDIPFSNNGLGTGGICKVDVVSLGDGDTTVFKFPTNSGVNKPSYSRVRYLLIDTPEVDHGSNSVIKEEPFGQEAKQFNNSRLKNATMIVAQSNKNKTLHENYGRTLAYIWYTTKLNPTIDDLILFNNEIIHAGLARMSSYDKYEDMYYKDVLYYDYLDYGAKLAKSQKIKIYGEIDPNFNYN